MTLAQTEVTSRSNLKRFESSAVDLHANRFTSSDDRRASKSVNCPKDEQKRATAATAGDREREVGLRRKIDHLAFE